MLGKIEARGEGMREENNSWPKQEVCPRNNNHKSILNLKYAMTELNNSVLLQKNLDHAEELMTLKTGFLQLSSQEQKEWKRVKKSYGNYRKLEKKPAIFAFMEIQKKKTKGHKLYLKQYWLKTFQTWGEKGTPRSIGSKRSQIVWAEIGPQQDTM